MMNAKDPLDWLEDEPQPRVVSGTAGAVCYGVVDDDGRPCCSGTPVQLYRFDLPPDPAIGEMHGYRGVARWCRSCAAEAREAGATVTRVGLES